MGLGRHRTVHLETHPTAVGTQLCEEHREVVEGNYHVIRAEGLPRAAAALRQQLGFLRNAHYREISVSRGTCFWSFYGYRGPEVSLFLLLVGALASPSP